MPKGERREGKKNNNSFTCPYCEKFYKSQNLKHLLDCVVKAEGSDAVAKLKAFKSNQNSALAFLLFIELLNIQITFDSYEL